METLTSIAPVAGQLSAVEVVLTVLLACGLGLAIATVYRLTNRNRAITQSFMLTLIILAMVVALVMMIIGNSIARAFTLVGALAIIRFRTVVKDNRDIAFVFFALAAGMAAGVGNLTVALWGVVSILAILLALDFVQFGTAARNTYLLRLHASQTGPDEGDFLELFRQLFVSHIRLSSRTVHAGEFVEHAFMVRLRRKVNAPDVMAKLAAIAGVERVSLVAEDSEAEF